MYYLKPNWLTHGGVQRDVEVYSGHVSPDGTRLATGGGDGLVRIWSTEAIYNSHDPSYDKPTRLASLSHHSGTVHAVRFSPNGRYVASGADDKIVCVYALDPSAPSRVSTFGTNEPPAVENWRIFRRLVAHENDVQDLGWSYDGSILVSVGLDSRVVVWSGHTFEKLKTIASHQSHIKGICFDPANKYFATASDDRTMKIFSFNPPSANSSSHDHLNNFTLERTISAPFTLSPLSTYFRRCSWSPDGLHIGAANAINGPSPSVAIINRGSWDGDINLIGHDQPTQVCAFSPRLYSKDPHTNTNGANPSPNQHLVTVIACGGLDMTLTVWITSNPRPLLIAREFTTTAITDLAWDPNGTSLFVTSMDGSISCVTFEEGELGYAMDMVENDKTLTKFGTNRKGAGMVESADGFLLEERSKAGEMRGAQGRMGELMGDALQDAKVNGNTTPLSAPSVPTIVAPPATTNGNVNGLAPPDSTEVATAKVEKMKSMVYRDEKGRKRVRPMSVNLLGAESTLPQPQPVAANQGPKSDMPRPILDLSKPFDGLPKGGLATLLLGTKRKLATIEGDEDGRVEKRIAQASQNGATPIVINTVDGLLPAQPSAPITGQVPTPEFLRPAVVNPAITVSTTRLAVPKLRNQLIRAIDVDGQPSDPPAPNELPKGEWVFEVRNPGPASLTGRAQDREPAKVYLTRRSIILWQDFLPRGVVLATGNQSFWAAACEDGSIYVWSPAGRRMVNAMIMEAQPVILECNGPWILCVNAIGLCYVWNMKTMSSPHAPTSLAPVLDAALHSLTAHAASGPAVAAARVNSEGRIVVALTNGEGYSYSPTMFIWQRLSEPWWAVGSQYWNSTDFSAGNIQSSNPQLDEAATVVSTGIIPFLERNTTTETLLRGRAYHLQRLVKTLIFRDGYDFFESAVSIAHLENRVAGALMLGSKEEFRQYLLMYAKRLGSENARFKVEELLAMLLGGVDEDATEESAKKSRQQILNGRNWHGETEELCGWSRRTLLKDVLLVLGKNRELQRTTVPYARLVGVMGDIDPGEPMAS